jgi:hypothetical protein
MPSRTTHRHFCWPADALGDLTAAVPGPNRYVAGLQTTQPASYQRKTPNGDLAAGRERRSACR